MANAKIQYLYKKYLCFLTIFCECIQYFLCNLKNVWILKNIDFYEKKVYNPYGFIFGERRAS